MTSLHYRPKFSAINPHFFMRVPKGACRDSKPSIPKEFLKKYGDDLSNQVFLKLPSGSKWKLELRRWNGKAWFDMGWAEFSEYYSLDYCHSLIFRYEGNSKFCVSILDRSFTEIEYPLTTPERKETDSDDDSCANSDDYSEDGSVEIIDKFRPCPRKTREKSPFPCPRPHKKHRTSSNGKVDFAAKGHDRGTVGRMHSSTKCGKAIPLQRAKAYKSDKPSLIVPKMEETDEDDDSVDTLDEFRSRPKTRKKSPKAPHPHKKNRTCSTSKAKNHIKDFGGSSKTQKSLVRRPEVPRRMHPVVASGKDRAFERANGFSSKYPSFKAAIGPSNIRGGYLSLPAEFVKEHFDQTHDNVLLRVSDERSWPVNLGNYAPGIVRLQGWMTFMRENHLEIGDVCVFELINDIKPIFNVVFFRASEAASFTLSPGRQSMSGDQFNSKN